MNGKRWDGWRRMKGLLGVLAALLLLAGWPGFASAGINQWTSSGPEGGSIYTLAVDPINPATIYAGISSGGVFKSIDGGGSWNTVNSGLTGTTVMALAIDPQDTAILYAGLTPGGVFKSSNGGGSWSAINNGLTNTRVRSLAIDPQNTAIIYAGTDDGGIFKSSNGGGSWSAINSGLTNIFVLALAIDPQNPSNLYAGTYLGGVFKSSDGGNSWTAINSGLTKSDVGSLAIDPRNPSILFAGTYSGGVFKSTDGGNRWNAANSGLASIDVRALAVDPQNPGIIYAATKGGVYMSSDDGASWSGVSSGLTNTQLGALAIDPQNSAILYAGSSDLAGVFKTDNGGKSWNAVNTGLMKTTVYSLAIAPETNATIYAGTNSKGVFKSSNGGGSWSPINSGLSGDDVKAFALDSLNPSILYAGTSFGVFKSSNGGSSWSWTGLLAQVKALAVDPQTPATLYAGTAGGVFKSGNGGGNWSAINSGLTNTDVLSLAIDPQNPATLYAGTGKSGVFKSSNGGGSWSAANTGLEDAIVHALAVDPQNPTTVFAGTEGRGVFKSTNGGGSWRPVNNGLTNVTAFALAIDPQNPAILYAGTYYGGVFKSSDGGGSWATLNNGLTPAGAYVRALAIDPQNPATLYAGTFGGGVFSLTQVNPTIAITPSTLDLGSVATGITATNTLTAANTGTADLAITSVAITGPDAAMFDMDPGTCGGLVGTWPPGFVCSWEITFAPTSAGAKSATLVIESNDPATPISLIPLSGTGVVPTYTLGVTVTGSGTVHSSPGTDIACTGGCGQSYSEGTVVTLTAEPASGFSFAGWSGACSGTESCKVTMSEARSVTATFTASSGGGGGATGSSENFNIFNMFMGGWVGSQWQTGLPVMAGAVLPGWTGTGVHPFHIVVRDGGQDGAVMLFDYSQVYALDSGWASNQSGVTYEVSFEIGPTVWEISDQATQAGDGVRFEILRADNSVLASYISYPAAWNGVQTFGSDSFQYVGDGSGDVRVRLSGVAPERFGGAVDNLQIAVASASHTSNLPKTGQTTSYAAGDDGDLQTGRAWPVPRFTDNGDQTVTDNLTGLIWAQDASMPTVGTCTSGANSWQNALDYIACLNSSSYLGFTDWRLPNINELKSLLNTELNNTAGWLNSQGFANVARYYYWSSTTQDSNPILAWDVNMNDGHVSSYYKTYGFSTWPVRGVSSLPRTGQTACWDEAGDSILCAGTGQDGDLQAGTAWPNPRFVAYPNQMVTDGLSGLNWTRDGNAPGPAACGPGVEKTWQGALDYVACLNSNAYLGFTDWRLPNLNELESLIHAEQPDNAAWLNGQGFTGVQAAAYWTGNTLALSPPFAWGIGMSSGGADAFDKLSSRRVWPVRSGQSGATGNVPAGTDVLVTHSAGGRVEFDTVSTAGTLTMVPTANPAPPANFRIVTGAFFEITTTAVYSGPVTVCLDYSDAALADQSNEANIRLFHHTGQNWDDITTSVDTQNNRVCGVTDSFSPFAVAEPVGSYTITATVSGSGSITPAAGATPVSAGGSQTYTFTPDPGYEVQNVIVNSFSKGPLDSYTFSNVQADQTIQVFFASMLHTVTASATAGGTISPVGTREYVHGTSPTYTITPQAGYHVEDVLVGSDFVGALTSYTFPSIDADATIHAIFAANPSWTISASFTGSGTVTPAGDTVVLGGTHQRYSFIPAAGYRIGSVVIDGADKGVQTSWTFSSVSADHTVAVNFVADTFNITVSAGSNGGIAPAGVTTVSRGDSQTYTFTPDAGYRVQNVLVNGVSHGAPGSYTIANVQADQTISVSFVKLTHTVTSSATAGGTISPLGSREYVEGTSPTYYITPAAGYHVEDVLVGGVSVGAVTNYTFNSISASQPIHAVFAANPGWTISASLTGSGTVTPIGDTVVAGGTHQSYSFTPAAGYRIGSVVVDGANKGVQTSWTFSNVTADHTLVVNFVPDTFDITATAGTGGGISPAGVTTVSRGGGQTYTFTPNPGYVVQSVLVNGVSKGALTSYTFSNVQANQTIKVFFMPVQHTVTASVTTTGGVISPAGSRQYSQGTNPLYYIVPATGYKVADVLVNGVSQGAVTKYTFSNIAASYTIEASFVLK